MPTSYPWHDFLSEWSRTLIRLNRKPQLWFPQAAASQWLGTAGATEAEIKAVETKLRTTLPHSYRSFLATTNGWSVLTPSVSRVYSVAEIGWYGPRHPDQLTILRGDLGNPLMSLIARLFGWTTTSPDGDEDEIPVAHLQSALEVVGGSYTDAVEYVLNPLVQTADGEWEAWIIHWQKPLAMERYPSFWDLMQAEYRSVQ